MFPSTEKPPEKQRPAAEAPLVKHVLSKSLLAYHEKMTTAVLSQDPVLRDEALKHFATDTGISELAPYLVQMASERVTTGLGNLDVLERMIGMLESLMDNAEVDLEPYVGLFANPNASHGRAANVPFNRHRSTK